MNNYVLAMYDVRGKQDFIYRSRKCKEIIGGSHIIADVFKDYLFPAVEEYCGKSIYSYNQNADISGDVEQFSLQDFKMRLESEKYIGEVVYEGGGNFLVLYKDKESCIAVNKVFTKKLLESIGTLKVLCTYIENLDFNNYQADQQRLYDEHRINEAQESVIFPVNTIPFVEVSPETSRPFTHKIKIVGKNQMVTTEQYAKYCKYDEYISKTKHDQYDQEEYLLDNLVTERGTESLLAVIYIDGNSMGAKVQACLNGKKSYEECVNQLRVFSSEIGKNYVQERREAINTTLEAKYGDKKFRRTIVAAGDEMTIICNARDALDVVRAYFRDLPDGNSSCAGIAIFHSHAPYSDAYRIAEECCENAKKMMRRAEVTEANLVDFHYCQGGIGISLKEIRRREGLEGLLSKPWRLEDKAQGISAIFSDTDLNDHETCNQVLEMVDVLNRLGHSNVKRLRQAAQLGTEELAIELKRIKAHSEISLDFSLNGKFGNEEMKDERLRKLIFDIVTVYDLWFKGEKKHDTKENS